MDYVSANCQIISFIVGLAFQRFDYSCYLLALTFVITEVAIVFPWPVYNKHPLKWQARY